MLDHSAPQVAGGCAPAVTGLGDDAGCVLGVISGLAVRTTISDVLLDDGHLFIELGLVV